MVLIQEMDVKVDMGFLMAVMGLFSSDTIDRSQEVKTHLYTIRPQWYIYCRIKRCNPIKNRVQINVAPGKSSSLEVLSFILGLVSIFIVINCN